MIIKGVNSILGLLALLLMLTIFFSCEKKLKLEVETVPRLVVSSFLEADSIAQVTVLASQHILADREDIVTIEDANVALFEGDNFVETLQFVGNPFELNTYFRADTFGVYQSNYRIKAGEEYRLEISAEGYENVEATCEIPRRVMIDELVVNQLRPNNTTDYSASAKANVRFGFQDAVGVGDYYWVQIFRERYEYVDESLADSVLYWEPVLFEMQEEAVENLYNGLGYLLSDASFNEEHVDMHATIYLPCDEMDCTNLPIRVELRKIEEAYYQALKSYQADQATNFNPYVGFIEVFQEATLIYSNVENGYGVFAGSAVAWKMADLED